MRLTSIQHFAKSGIVHLGVVTGVDWNSSDIVDSVECGPGQRGDQVRTGLAGLHFHDEPPFTAMSDEGGSLDAGMLVRRAFDLKRIKCSPGILNPFT